jgi:hypothetical protein
VTPAEIFSCLFDARFRFSDQFNISRLSNEENRTADHRKNAWADDGTEKFAPGASRRLHAGIDLGDSA